MEIFLKINLTLKFGTSVSFASNAGNHGLSCKLRQKKNGALFGGSGSLNITRTNWTSHKQKNEPT